MGASPPPSASGQLAPIFLDVDRYIGELFAAEDDALAGVTRTIEDAGMPQISVSQVDGKLLHLLVQLTGARRILELGTLGGYSTIWMARALPPGGRLISVELSPEYAEVARRNLERAGVQERVTIRVGAALDVLAEMHAEDPSPFDLVFIDADKPPYLEYFRWALRFSRPGTLIVADNVIRDGEVLNPDTEDDKVRGIQRFNAALAAETRVTSVILQTVGAKGHDGMALAVVRA
jgi:caffeoyl-CoA O-methyltransferase